MNVKKRIIDIIDNLIEHQVFMLLRAEKKLRKDSLIVRVSLKNSNKFDQLELESFTFKLNDMFRIHVIYTYDSIQIN